MKNERNPRWSPLAIVTVLLAAFFMATTIALAGATWNIDIGNTPSWDGADWIFQGTVTLTNPHHYSCVHVSVPDGPNAGTYRHVCTGGGGAGTHSFQCVIPGSSVASTSVPAQWYLFADSNSSCTSGNIVRGPEGYFGPTGPTAVTLKEVAVGADYGYLPFILIAVVVIAAAAGLVVLWRGRSSKHLDLR
jgi:hypothetical protein